FAAVGPINPTRSAPALIFSRIHSEPVLVLPNPRPAMTSHTGQLPGGATCSGLAKNRQSWTSASASLSVRRDRRFALVEGGSLAIDKTCELVSGIGVLNWSAILAGV